MAKYEKKSDRPVVDAVRIKWNASSDVRIPNGSWIIKAEDGYTTYCDDGWFKAHYQAVDE